MAKIPQYDAPDSLVPKPSQRGYHAAIEAARYIYRVQREGNADLKTGLNEIGTALEGRERRKEREEAKREREEAKAEARAEKEANKQERLNKQALADAKATDKERFNAEKIAAVGQRNALGDRFTRERKALEAQYADHPEQLPAALDKWMNETVRPEYDKWRSTFTSKAGSDWAHLSAETDIAHARYHVKAASNTAAGNAVVFQAKALTKSAVEHIYNHPEDYEHESLKLQQGMNSLTSHMQPGGGGKGVLNAPTPEDVTEEHLAIFRTLEGNLSGHADHDVSHAGAVGRNQIMPATARGYGFDSDRLQDAGYNDKVAKAIISDLSKRYNGDLAAMAVAYNAGPGRANQWIAAGRNDSVLPGETQKYLANAREHGFIGPAGSAAGTPGVATRAGQNKQIQTEYNTAQRQAFQAYVLGTADTNPTAARQILATHQDRRYLTLSDLAHMPTAIDNAERHTRLREANQEKQTVITSTAISDQKAMQYLSQLHDEAGRARFPNGWADAVKNDSALRAETRASLLTANERLVAAYPEKDVAAWYAKRDMQRGEEVKSNPDFVRNIIARIAHPTPANPAVTTEELLSYVGNANKAESISSHDAAFLLSGINPRSGAADQAFKDLNRNIEEIHSALAPPNPDGSRNEAGEIAFRRAMGDFLPKYKQQAATGNAVGALDPKDPTYLRRNNYDQKFAAGHEDLVKATGAGSDMPSDMALRQEHNDAVAGAEKPESYESWLARTHPGAATKPLPKIFESLNSQPEEKANEPQRLVSGQPAPWEQQQTVEPTEETQNE